ncbi:MAG: hypothetical protein WKF96_16935 [Solirubrobacteraceae bacterium]
MDVADIIDAAVTRRVLVVGSLPPAGRDYDLLAREADRPTIAAALEAHGFEATPSGWMRFRRGSPEIVELMTPADWGLPGHESDALFERACALDGLVRMCVPAPADELLILARKLPRTPGFLARKHRVRVRSAVDRAPNAWDDARRRARIWGVYGRVRFLQARSARPYRPGWPPRWLRRPRRGAVVALSGLDGVGKSTQAEALRATLTKLGFDAVVIWSPLGSSPRMRRMAQTVKQALARLPFGPLAHADRGTLHQRVLSQAEGGALSGGGWRRVGALAWSTALALVNAMSYRRSARGASVGGRVVIYDRYVLDSIVHLRFAYAPDARLPLQEALIRRIAPTPRCAFLLDAPPEVAHARKPDWSLDQTRVQAQLYRREHARLGVRRLDAEHPADELTSRLTHEVLRAIAS